MDRKRHWDTLDTAAALTWIEADVTADWSLKPMDIWQTVGDVVEAVLYAHRTPWRTTQAFQYSRFTRVH